MLIIALAFRPSLYILLEVVTSTPIYTMEVNSSSKRIEKYSGKAMYHFFEGVQTLSTVVCELELKYGTNYTEVFVFKQLACYAP